MLMLLLLTLSFLCHCCCHICCRWGPCCRHCLAVATAVLIAVATATTGATATAGAVASGATATTAAIAAISSTGSIFVCLCIWFLFVVCGGFVFLSFCFFVLPKIKPQTPPPTPTPPLSDLTLLPLLPSFIASFTWQGTGTQYSAKSVLYHLRSQFDNLPPSLLRISHITNNLRIKTRSLV